MQKKLNNPSNFVYSYVCVNSTNSGSGNRPVSTKNSVILSNTINTSNNAPTIPGGLKIKVSEKISLKRKKAV